MKVRRWMVRQYRHSSLTGTLGRQTTRTVAWLRAAWRTLPVFVTIVAVSALAEIDVSQFVLAVTWPTLTVLLLAVTDDTKSTEPRDTNTGRPAE